MATHARVLPLLFTRNPGITSKALLATRGVNIRSRHYTDVAQQSGTLDAGENVPVDVPDVCATVSTARVDGLLRNRYGKAGFSSIQCSQSG